MVLVDHEVALLDAGRVGDELRRAAAPARRPGDALAELLGRRTLTEAFDHQREGEGGRPREHAMTEFARLQRAQAAGEALDVQLLLQHLLAGLGE